MALFLLIAAITIVGVWSIESGQKDRMESELRARTVSVSSALESRANSSSAFLRAGAALLASLDDIPPYRFRRFVSELRLDADYYGGDGIGWAMAVYPDEVDAYNRFMDEEGVPGSSLRPTPDGSQPYSVPITLLQPKTERNRRALGFDMFSEERRRQAMIAAENTSRPTATGKIILEQDSGTNAPGFIIYMPVFGQTPTGRSLRGYIFSPFNAQDFLSSVVRVGPDEGYRIRVYDGEVSPDNLMASVGPANVEGSTALRRLEISNHGWVLEVTAANSNALSGLAMATLIFGLLVACLLMLIVQILTRQALEDDASLQWFTEQSSIRNSLTRELNHRVKNTLANVLSIIALTRRRSTGLDEFADSLDGRIRALSATHDLLTNSDWGTTPVRAVIEAELRPYATGTDHQLHLSGPDVELAPNDALSLGLAIHELATNAAKYGPLKTLGGKVSVEWRRISEGLVEITWEESGGPPVAPIRGRGFGTDLIERIVAKELNNPVKLEFNPEGVRCVLTIPVRRPTAFSIRARRLQGEG